MKRSFHALGDPRSALAGPTTVASALVERLRADIVAGALALEEKLRLPALCARYNCGLNPLREALTRLAATGLVEVADQKGFRVASASPEDLRDLTRVRHHIESLALCRAIEFGDAEWEGRIVSVHQRLARMSITVPDNPLQLSDAWEAVHQEFHDALVSACQSRWLLHFHALLAEQSARYRRLSVSYDAGARDIAGEHAALAEAALARDGARICTLIAAHFTRTVETIVSAQTARP